MTFDKYRVALENYNFKVDYDTKLHNDCIPGYSYGI